MAEQRSFMVNAARWAGYLCLFSSIVLLSHPIPRAQAFRGERVEASLDIVEINDKGGLSVPDQVEKLTKRLAGARPTHVFLMAHGWLNTKAGAKESFEKMLEVMTASADKHELRPDGFRPAMIGVYWPSLALEDNNSEDVKLLLERLPPQTAAKLTTILKKVGKIEADDLEALFQKEMPRDKVAKVFSLAQLFMGKDFAGPDGGDRPDLTALDENDVKSLIDAVRIFSYWKMKKRAGTVGVNGARRLLMELQAELPGAEFHLIGHSFGCKVWLSALSGKEKESIPKPVHSLVLLQAAISTQAFAEAIPTKDKPIKGGAHVILADHRVKGPIVATFSALDGPVKRIYPLASRAAGHVGESEFHNRKLKKSAYQGMGAYGIDQVKAREILAPGKKYGFEDGVHSINAETKIKGHKDIYEPEVAWLIWAAVLRK